MTTIDEAIWECRDCLGVFRKREMFKGKRCVHCGSNTVTAIATVGPGIEANTTEKKIKTERWIEIVATENRYSAVEEKVMEWGWQPPGQEEWNKFCWSIWMPTGR